MHGPSALRTGVGCAARRHRRVPAHLHARINPLPRLPLKHGSQVPRAQPEALAQGVQELVCNGSHGGQERFHHRAEARALGVARPKVRPAEAAEGRKRGRRRGWGVQA